MPQSPRRRRFLVLKIVGLIVVVAVVFVEIRSSAWSSFFHQYSHRTAPFYSGSWHLHFLPGSGDLNVTELYLNDTTSLSTASTNTNTVLSVSQKITSSVGRNLSNERIVTGIPPDGSGYAVTVPVSGQLGNQMFQYASLLGIAHNHGRRPFYSASSKLNAYKASFLESRSSDRSFTLVYEDNFATYDPKFEKLPNSNVLLMQYLQSWKYFDHIRSLVLREFTFQDHVKAAAVGLLEKHASLLKNRTLIGIHIRRGDMLLPHEVAKGYHVAPDSYVKKAMDLMRQRHGHVAFVIVTSDTQYSLGQLLCPECVVAEAADVTVHLALLASCHHVIMTVGTLGWWGGYLAGGEVVYYWNSSVMLSDPPRMAELRRPADFYLPAWSPLGD